MIRAALHVTLLQHDQLPDTSDTGTEALGPGEGLIYISSWGTPEGRRGDTTSWSWISNATATGTHTTVRLGESGAQPGLFGQGLPQPPGYSIRLARTM